MIMWVVYRIFPPLSKCSSKDGRVVEPANVHHSKKDSNALLEHTFTNNCYLNNSLIWELRYTLMGDVRQDVFQTAVQKNPPLKDATFGSIRVLSLQKAPMPRLFSQKKQPPGVSVHHCCDSELIVCPGWFWHRLRVEVRKPRKGRRAEPGGSRGGAVLQWVVC